MTKYYYIERVELDGNVELLDVVSAADAGEALRNYGASPDEEGEAVSGYYPENEYGRGWYPHLRAIPMKMYEIVVVDGNGRWHTAEGTDIVPENEVLEYLEYLHGAWDGACFGAVDVDAEPLRGGGYSPNAVEYIVGETQ